MLLNLNSLNQMGFGSSVKRSEWNIALEAVSRDFKKNSVPAVSLPDCH